MAIESFFESALTAQEYNFSLVYKVGTALAQGVCHVDVVRRNRGVVGVVAALSKPPGKMPSASF